VFLISRWDLGLIVCCLQLGRAKVGFGELYRDNKRQVEREEQTAQLLDRAMDRIESLERFAHGQALWIDDLRGQVSTLRGDVVPPSVLLSPSPRSDEEVADEEAEVEEEAEVRTMVESPAFQEVEGPGFTIPEEENEDPLPIAGTSIIPRPGVGYERNAEHRAWILGTIRARQEAARREYEARDSEAMRRRMVMEAFEDPASDFDPRVDS
jgi:hypothetical protein